MEWAGKPDASSARQIIATCKHYAAYDLERWNGVVRYSFDAIVPMQDLVEYYLPPFRQCARDSNVGSIMCSYNRVNGTPACADEYLMQTVLREHWNWTGHNNYIVSDCNAIYNIYADHKWVKTAAQAAGAAYTAGTDNVCEYNRPTDVIGAYNQSLLSVQAIDRALRRQYEGLIRADYFNSAINDTTGLRSLGWKDVNGKYAHQLALDSAADGMVLLKNDGTLPMDLNNNKSIAVVGMWANDTSTRMLGNYYGKPPLYETPLLAAQKRGLNVIYADGPVSGTSNYSSAVKAAAASDIILYFGGIDTSIEAEDRDRTTITWPAVQLELLHELSGLGKPLIVVQLGTQVDNTPLLANKDINSILWAGYPGMYGGEAAMAVISGSSAPAGRLPITQYPGNYTDRVPMTDMSLRPSDDNPGRTYKWFQGAVQEFGFGLHYTNFTVRFGAPYGNSSITGAGRKLHIFQADTLLGNCEQAHKDLCAFPPFPIVVKNTGTVKSDFVALGFLTTKEGPAPQPIKELAAYRRLRDIEPGETREVELEFTFGELARVDLSGNLVFHSGTYCLGLDVPQQASLCFEVLGEDTVFDKWPQPKSK
jgi:beta-D-xylosidase 4